MHQQQTLLTHIVRQFQFQFHSIFKKKNFLIQRTCAKLSCNGQDCVSQLCQHSCGNNYQRMPGHKQTLLFSGTLTQCFLGVKPFSRGKYFSSWFALLNIQPLLDKTHLQTQLQEVQLMYFFIYSTNAINWKSNNQNRV